MALRRLTALIGLILLAGATTAGAECLKSRQLKLTPNEQNGYGTYVKYPALPLNAGEYVLTFDDGPNPNTTPQILEALDSYCVKATFFMLGKSAKYAPEVARLVQQKGHTIGTHSFSHGDMTKMPFDQAQKQIDMGRAYVAKALHPDMDKPTLPTLFRFPFNAMTPETEAYVKSQHMMIISNDMTALDWRNLDSDISMEVLDKAMTKQDRGIILLHDIQPNTAILIPKLLKYMAEKHYTVVQLVQ